MGTPGKTAAAAVVGNADIVVDDDRAIVDVGDAVDINSVDGGVVVEVVAVPIAPTIAGAYVAEAVVNSPIEADVRAPVAAVEAIEAVVKAPVTRGPKGAIVGGRAPDAGNPVVASWCVAPVAGGPDIVRAGRLRLVVGGQRGRRFGGLFIECGLAGVDLGVVVGVVGRVIGYCACLSVVRGILLGLLLALVWGTLWSDTVDRCSPCRWLQLRLWLLASVNRCHICVSGIGAGVVRLLSRGDSLMATRDDSLTCKGGETNGEAQRGAANKFVD
jgi:hypothetical protein